MTRTKEEVAKYIADFLSQSGGAHDWDDFISIRISKNPELEAIRLKCGNLRDLYPAVEPRQFCNDEGMEVLRQILQSLREQP